MDSRDRTVDSEESESVGERVSVSLPRDAAADELVLAFRVNGELDELASIAPPVRGEIERED
ncbi:MAG: hypothetical protein ABEJ23_02425 [Haloarculaceae archaeon]